jgi:hypothetical protein
MCRCTFGNRPFVGEITGFAGIFLGQKVDGILLEVTDLKPATRPKTMSYQYDSPLLFE